jgi:hypothetical protein
VEVDHEQAARTRLSAVGLLFATDLPDALG